LKSGDGVEFILETWLAQVYRARVEQAGIENLSVRMEQHFPSGLRSAIHSRATLKIYTDLGIFKFKGKIRSSDGEGILTFGRPKRIEYVQQRAFYRLRFELSVMYEVVKPEESPDTVTPVLQGFTKDISEGGMLLVTQSAYAPGTILKLLINLGPDMVISSLAVVRRQRKDEVKEQMLTSLQFMKLSEKDRDALRRFVLTRSIPFHSSTLPNPFQP
jgi:c-di-GMP-binding flagellar brake protein YcgR